MTKDEDTQEIEDRAYERGRQFAHEFIAKICLSNLPTWEDRKKAELILERQDAIRALREICREHGDNDWPDNLYLADIIEKHLYRHLGDE